MSTRTVYSLRGLAAKPHLNGELVTEAAPRANGRATVSLVYRVRSGDETTECGHTFSVPETALKLEAADDELDAATMARRVVRVRDSDMSPSKDPLLRNGGEAEGSGVALGGANPADDRAQPGGGDVAREDGDAGGWRGRRGR